MKKDTVSQNDEKIKQLVSQMLFGHPNIDLELNSMQATVSNQLHDFREQRCQAACIFTRFRGTYLYEFGV